MFFSLLLSEVQHSVYILSNKATPWGGKNFACMWFLCFFNLSCYSGLLWRLNRQLWRKCKCYNERKRKHKWLRLEACAEELSITEKYHLS